MLVKMQNLELFTIKDVANTLKISVHTIHTYLYRPGKCPNEFPRPVRMNGLVRWRTEDIKKYEDSLVKIDIPSCNQETTSKRRGRGRPRKIS